MTIIYFLLIFSVLVFVHEFGHFIVAKKLHLTVHEFGFGFPPRLWSKVWRGTRYSINAFPLGGFVRIKGEEGEEANDKDSFAYRPAWQRSGVIIAGVVMNVVLGWFLLTGGFLVGIPSLVDETIPSSAVVRDRALLIRAILPHAPATTVDFRVGDIIRKVEGQPVESVTELQDVLRDRAEQETMFTIERDGVLLERVVRPAYIPEAERIGIGVGLDEMGIVRYPFHKALWMGTRMTGALLRDIVVGTAQLLRDLVTTQKVSVDLSGPIGIAILTGQIAQRGFAHIAQFTAILSLNLAVLNALPIPALDGGRLFFLAIEKLRRRSLKKETEALIHRIGFILLLLLIVLVTYRDILKLIQTSP